MITQYHHSSCTGAVLSRLNSIIKSSHGNSLSVSGLVILTYTSPSFSFLGTFPQLIPFMAKKNMILLTEEWRKNNPPPPKQVPKPVPVARSSNSNVKKQPQAQTKGKGKAPATKPYSQGYRIPMIQQDAMENVFQMARTMMELQKKVEARFKYQK
ncbi:hypothetical protein O181_084422 [Austropuccinia psidii MF-1]|uniref:Uncharacterized protein n=1 Tax=Austropuccinia psidii MF-1 TaxID=1389203 RepID=A0A9Q3IKZ7_9BASI|nr:hypothetical protein [Austropuccinia psidii MF-1]